LRMELVDNDFLNIKLKQQNQLALISVEAYKVS
jgi:hypothetical protein